MRRLNYLGKVSHLKARGSVPGGARLASFLSHAPVDPQESSKSFYHPERAQIRKSGRHDRSGSRLHCCGGRSKSLVDRKWGAYWCLSRIKRWQDPGPGSQPARTEIQCHASCKPLFYSHSVVRLTVRSVPGRDCSLGECGSTASHRL